MNASDARSPFTALRPGRVKRHVRRHPNTDRKRVSKQSPAHQQHPRRSSTRLRHVTRRRPRRAREDRVHHIGSHQASVLQGRRTGDGRVWTLPQRLAGRLKSHPRAALLPSRGCERAEYPPRARVAGPRGEALERCWTGRVVQCGRQCRKPEAQHNRAQDHREQEKPRFARPAILREFDSFMSEC
jgi:hypothetical protein